MIVADTDVLIDYLCGGEPAAGRVTDAMARGQLCTTAVTRAELQRGVRTSKQRRAVADLLGALATLPLDAASADRAGELARELDTSGNSIAMADALIAGIALVHGATLMTRNGRHFSRVSGLGLEVLDSE